MMAITFTEDRQITNHGLRNPRFGRGGLSQIDHRASQVVSQRNPCGKQGTETLKIDKTIKICTWNVRSMYEPGKTANIIQEMQRLNIEILGISDVRWANSGRFRTNNGEMFYSGNNENHHRNGVAVIVSKNIVPHVINFVPVSDRVMLLQIRTNKTHLNIVQIYAPTADKPDEEVESFYEDINTVLRSLKSKDITMVLGDFNSKIGKGKYEKYVGEFGLGTRNERGERLLQFCQENDMIITNTFYKLPNRRLYTWKSPQDSNERTVRNQIDYILINERYKNSIKSAKTYPGADVFSDHSPLIVCFQIRFKRMLQKRKQHRIVLSQLRDQDICQLKQNINNNLKQLKVNENHQREQHINEKWKNFKAALFVPTETIVSKQKYSARQSWMTDEILQCMEKRRSLKAINNDQYKVTQKEIRRKCREAKEAFYTNKCEEIEMLQAKHDYFNLHKKVKELAGTTRYRQFNTLYDKNNKMIIEVQDKLKTWKEYIEKLFEENRNRVNLENMHGDEGPDIMKDEVAHVLSHLKNGKAVGPDRLPAEILKLIEEDQLQIMVDLFNTIYKTGIIPDEWLISTFITLPKKSAPKYCKDYRTISLMSHTLKAFLKVIHNRIYHKLEQDISENQFGFRNGLGTREALFALNVLSQRCLDMNRDIYICFLDYNKAFDKVRHTQLIEILKQKNMDSRDITIISNLYFGQRAVMQIEGEKTEEIEIRRGVRQGCVLSPMLFNLYSEEIMNKALINLSYGIKINGTPINNLRYADDTILIAETIQELQSLVNQVTDVSEEFGLSLNINKTKFMLISKIQQNTDNLYIRNHKIERVTKYNYLGTVINNNNDCSEEIKIRIGKARSGFAKMRRLFCSKDLSLELKVRLIRCYILSILYYGMEAWTIKKNDIKKIEAFEMWLYRRILKISWTERVTNIEVLKRMKKDKEVILTIKQRKLLYLGHIMRGEKYQMLQNIMQGKISGKRSIGRRRHSWLKNLRDWYGCTNSNLFRAAVSKIRIALMIANLRNEDGT